MKPGRVPHARLGVEDALVLAAVVVLPWLFGGVGMWAYRPAALVLIGALALGLLRGGVESLGLGRDATWLLPAFLLAGWAALQVLPLPPSVLGVVSPTACRIYRQTLPGFAGDSPADVVVSLESRAIERVPEAQGTPEPEERPGGFSPRPGRGWSGWRGISLQASATVERLLWYLALLAAFLHVRRRAADPRAARAYRLALFSLFAALAAVGLLQKATWNGKLLWVIEPRGGGLPFGPYVNGAHFSGVMELAVPWLLGCAWDRFSTMGRFALREPAAVLASLAAGGCLAAGLAASSKMGALLLAAGVMALSVTSVEGARRRLLALVCATLMVAGAAVALAGSGLGERARSFIELEGGSLVGNGRLVAWTAMGRMIRDFALTGCGFGTFRAVFPGYQPAGEADVWTQAHNDYLEILLEGGLAAAALVAWLGWGFWRRAARGRVPAGSAAGLGLLVGLAALSLHALVDCNHQIPANALVFVTAAALACAPEAREELRA